MEVAPAQRKPEMKMEMPTAMTMQIAKGRRAGTRMRTWRMRKQNR